MKLEQNLNMPTPALIVVKNEEPKSKKSKNRKSYFLACKQRKKKAWIG